MENNNLKTQLDGVSETLLIPLWARATETGRESPIIEDDIAVKVLDKIDYDFDKFSSAWMSQVGVAIRTMLLDKAAAEFIARNPGAVIINIGAGMDTRYFRLNNGKIRWYDLDLEEPIRFRNHFFKESINYKMISKSVFNSSWINDIDAADYPVLIIAEGILMYFEESSVRDLMGGLAKAFPGAEMLLEIMTPTLVEQSSRHETVKHMNAEFKWGVKSGKELENYSPGIHFINEWNYFDYHKKRWRYMGWLALIPAFKNRFNNRIVHLKFDDDGRNQPLV